MSNKKRTIALIATLDTKGIEARYIRDELLIKNKNVIVIDSGILCEAAGIEPDIQRSAVAGYGGYTIEEIRKSETHEAAVLKMAECVKVLLKDLFDKRMIDGVMCIAGAGSMIALPGMHCLPLGFPKLLVCPLLSGERIFEPFVRTSDIVLMHSVVDIIGINVISRVIYDNAVGLIIGMVDNSRSYKRESAQNVAITMFGQTTPGVMAAKEFLERKGYNCVVFHANGVGGRSMEELIEKEYFTGVLDYTLSEIAGQELGGLNKTSVEGWK